MFFTDAVDVIDVVSGVGAQVVVHKVKYVVVADRWGQRCGIQIRVDELVLQVIVLVCGLVVLLFLTGKLYLFLLPFLVAGRRRSRRKQVVEMRVTMRVVVVVVVVGIGVASATTARRA